MACGAASTGHFKSQVESALQLTEHDGPLQMTWQVAPSTQETLALIPTVSVQTELSQVAEPLSPRVRVHALPTRHSALQEVAQVPVQWFALEQDSEAPEFAGVPGVEPAH